VVDNNFDGSLNNAARIGVALLRPAIGCPQKRARNFFSKHQVAIPAPNEILHEDAYMSIQMPIGTVGGTKLRLLGLLLVFKGLLEVFFSKHHPISERGSALYHRAC
jgi:hypothetical protein